jgi:hypothetical protein
VDGTGSGSCPMAGFGISGVLLPESSLVGTSEASSRRDLILISFF